MTLSKFLWCTTGLQTLQGLWETFLRVSHLKDRWEATQSTILLHSERQWKLPTAVSRLMGWGYQGQRHLSQRPVESRMTTKCFPKISLVKQCWGKSFFPGWVQGHRFRDFFSLRLGHLCYLTGSPIKIGCVLFCFVLFCFVLALGVEPKAFSLSYIPKPFTPFWNRSRLSSNLRFSCLGLPQW